MWAPFLDYLRRETGVSIEMILREDYLGLVEALNNREIDMFEGGTFAHVAAMESGIAENLAERVLLGKTTYSSVIIVRKGDNAKSLVDLKGKKIAFTDEFSTSGYLLPRIMLSDIGVDNPDSFFSQIVLTGSHDHSIEAVLEGSVDSAGVGNFFIEFLPETKKNQIRIVAESQQIPTGPITVRKDFDAILKDKFRTALLSYGEAVPAEIKRITESDTYILQNDTVFDSVRGYYEKIRSMPKIKYAIPYRKLPAVFSEKIAEMRSHVLATVGTVFVIFILILIAVGIWARRRFSNFIGLVMAGIVALVAAIFTILQIVMLFSAMEGYALKKMGEMENTNLRVSAVLANKDENELLRLITETVKKDEVPFAKIFRNGEIIASDDKTEVGMSVVDEIRAGTFNRKVKNAVAILDPIILGDRRYATLQFGISFEPIAREVRHAIAINLIAMTIALLAGVVATVLARRRLQVPVRELAQAVDGLREGVDTNFHKMDDDIRPIASSISKLGMELIEKQRLLELKNLGMMAGEDSWNDDTVKEMEEKLKEIEVRNEHFLKLRRTEAVGSTPSWLRMMCNAAIRARDRDPVVILGPSGSGKTGVARVIHALSSRVDRPFGEFNCAEFSSADPLVVLGKLFGYGVDCGIVGIERKGQKGILEDFDGGTLFFDEIELLPIQAQQLLLLPLEGRPFNPAAGKGEARATNVRFIFASNEPLDDLVHAGRLRHDLLRRIRVRGVVNVPPLARRKDDIKTLALHFLAKRNVSVEMPLSLSHEALDLLVKFNYDRYNVSELCGALDQAFDNCLFEGKVQIEARHVNAEIREFAKHSFVDSKIIFDEGELAELNALRKHSFNITRAEKELGFTAGSKTLTNHFRGIVYSTLEKMDFDVQKTLLNITYPSSTPVCTARISAKIRDYIAAAKRQLNEGTAEKLFIHLPQKYHIAVEKLLDAIRKGNA